MAPIYLGKRVVPSSLRYIENLALWLCEAVAAVLKIKMLAFAAYWGWWLVSVWRNHSLQGWSCSDDPAHKPHTNFSYIFRFLFIWVLPLWSGRNERCFGSDGLFIEVTQKQFGFVGRQNWKYPSVLFCWWFVENKVLTLSSVHWRAPCITIVNK